jgi:hypothetical protein
MWQKHNMLGSGGFGVNGCITHMDDSPQSLSSSNMLEKHALDDAISL